MSSSNPFLSPDPSPAVPPAITDATESIYQSLGNNNEDIDLHIQALKNAMAASGLREAVFTSARLPQNNRQGRKMMQSYFKKRGVAVVFGD